MRKWSIAFLCIALGWAQNGFSAPGGTSKPDPYLLPASSLVVPGSPNYPNYNTKAVALRDQQTVSASVRNLILIGIGQSNMANSPQASVYIPANPAALDQFNIGDGGIYAAADPALGTSINNYPAFGGGNPLLRIADALVTGAFFDRVIIASIAVDGAAIADWDPTLSGSLSARIPALFARLASKGLVAGINVTVAVLWGQGETDTFNGTTQTAYTNSLTNIINASRTAGFTGPWFIAKETWNGITTSFPIQSAQLGIVNHGANIWAGPDADSIVGTTCSGLVCRPDNLHFGDNGMPVYVGNSIGWISSLHAFGVPF